MGQGDPQRTFFYNLSRKRSSPKTIRCARSARSSTTARFAARTGTSIRRSADPQTPPEQLWLPARLDQLPEARRRIVKYYSSRITSRKYPESSRLYS
jgi:hypothetical protein